MSHGTSSDHHGTPAPDAPASALDEALARVRGVDDPLADPDRLRRVDDTRMSTVLGDPEWTRVARLARVVTGTPVALVTVVSATHVVVAASDGRTTGLEAGATEPAALGTCGWVVRAGTPMVVRDLALEPRTAHAGAARQLGLVAYLGVPLRAGDAAVIGTLSVFDDHPRDFTPGHVTAMEDLAHLLGEHVALVEERRSDAEMLRLHADVVSGSLSGSVVIDDRGVVLQVNPALTALLGWEPADVVGRRVADVLIPEGMRAAHDLGLDRVRGGGEHVVVGRPLQVLALARDGELVPIELSVTRSESAAGTRYNGSLRDLRPQTRVQAGLDAVLSQATVAVLEVDLAGVVRRTEGHGLLGGADLVGMTLDDVLGHQVTRRLRVGGDDGNSNSSNGGDRGTAGGTDDGTGPVRFDLEVLGRAWRASAVPVRPTGADVSGWVVSLIDISDVREAQAQLEKAYRTDPLTGLLSRVGLEQEVAALEAAAPGRPLRITTLRLHGLGETNESFGHEVGDELLRVSAGRLRTLLPGTGEVLARVGAGQFSLVGYADRSVSTGWARAAARLLGRPVRVRAVTVLPEVSVGTADLDAAVGTTTEHPVDTGTGVAELLRRAEVAVHGARRAGQVVRAYRRSDDVAARRMVLASNLRGALGAPADGRGRLDLDGRLELAYQPVVSLVDGRVVAVEALLRWTDETLGPVSPVEVVDVAEGAGLAIALGEHVMARALAEAATWWRRGDEVPVTVNLSALQVCEPSLVGSTTGLLARNGLPGRALVVEVTETAALRDAAMAATVLQQVREQGIRVYLDDFGTGWSTLERMGSLPLDGIKLDRVFVGRLEEPSGLAALRSAVALARSLQVPLVVEGVETARQARAVTAAGAEQGQGYLFSRPVPAAALTAVLRGGALGGEAPAGEAPSGGADPALRPG
ncbi:EAL domain-containing protein [Aquipuribacter sp. MA13-6]|uniref:EAL domain-containing protein n=1 Tax=unclassified Aquipuribacter TaxID=2635084 RepID=UPI003EED29EF